MRSFDSAPTRKDTSYGLPSPRRLYNDPSYPEHPQPQPQPQPQPEPEPQPKPAEPQPRQPQRQHPRHSVFSSLPQDIFSFPEFSAMEPKPPFAPPPGLVLVQQQQAQTRGSQDEKSSFPYSRALFTGNKGIDKNLGNIRRSFLMNEQDLRF